MLRRLRFWFRARRAARRFRLVARRLRRLELQSASTLRRVERCEAELLAQRAAKAHRRASSRGEMCDER